MFKKSGRRNIIIPSYNQFHEIEKEDSDGKHNDHKVPKGYIPVLIGKENQRAKFLIHVKMFKEACFVELLEKVADEFGYEHQGGVLQIPYDARCFINMVKHFSRGN